MNRTRSTRYRVILVVLVVVVLSAALIGLPGGPNSSAEPAAVTRSPRPHPQSHLKLSEPGSTTPNPRPHPKSHLRLTVTVPVISQP